MEKLERNEKTAKGTFNAFVADPSNDLSKARLCSIRIESSKKRKATIRSSIDENLIRADFPGANRRGFVFPSFYGVPREKGGMIAGASIGFTTPFIERSECGFRLAQACREFAKRFIFSSKNCTDYWKTITCDLLRTEAIFFTGCV